MRMIFSTNRLVNRLARRNQDRPSRTCAACPACSAYSQSCICSAHPAQSSRRRPRCRSHPRCAQKRNRPDRPPSRSSDSDWSPAATRSSSAPRPRRGASMPPTPRAPVQATTPQCSRWRSHSDAKRSQAASETACSGLLSLFIGRRERRTPKPVSTTPETPVKTLLAEPAMASTCCSTRPRSPACTVDFCETNAVWTTGMGVKSAVLYDAR